MPSVAAGQRFLIRRETPTTLIRRRRRRRRECNRKILRGKPTSCRVIPGRPALLGWRRRRPSRTAPLGMTKTPTLQVSADMQKADEIDLDPDSDEADDFAECLSRYE